MLQSRPKLIARGDRLLRTKADGTEELLAELPIQNLARLLAAAPLLEELLSKATTVVMDTAGDAREMEGEMEQVKLATEMKHALRLAAEELLECSEPGCQLSSAPGAQYCEYHVLYSPLSETLGCCLVRDCALPIACRLLLCRPHFDSFEAAGGRRILEWLEGRVAPAPQEAAGLPQRVSRPSPVPGLGEQITRSGLPVGIDPRPVEEALIAGAGSLCIAGDCRRPRMLDRVWCEAHSEEVDDSLSRRP